METDQTEATGPRGVQVAVALLIFTEVRVLALLDAQSFLCESLGRFLVPVSHEVNNIDVEILVQVSSV